MEVLIIVNLKLGLAYFFVLRIRLIKIFFSSVFIGVHKCKDYVLLYLVRAMLLRSHWF